jgi:hypothetical protein
MKPLLAIITLLAALSFLYFWVVCFVSFLRARGELKPAPKQSWLPAVLANDSYIDRGKEFMARYYRAFFFGMASALVMVMSGSAYVHLRDGVPGPWPPKSPFFIAVPAMIHTSGNCFRRQPSVAARPPPRRGTPQAEGRDDERVPATGHRAEHPMGSRLVRDRRAFLGHDAEPVDERRLRQSLDPTSRACGTRHRPGAEPIRDCRCRTARSGTAGRRRH